METMLRVEQNAQMTAAITRCKKVHPKVRRTSASTVTVSGRHGSYTVTLTEPKPGLHLASCDCAAGKAGRLCYHVPAAMAAPVAPLAPMPVLPAPRKSRWAERERAILVRPQPKGEKYGCFDI
jgi:hypothetical protein